jgi:hypothetical protein
MGTLADAEAAFLAAREAWDRHGIAMQRGVDDVGVLAAEASRLTAHASATLEAAADPADAEDGRALATMRERVSALGAADAGDAETDTYAAFTLASQSLSVDGQPIQRLAILGRLAIEPDPARRRALFGALEPLWHAVDGDGGAMSPYRELMRGSASALDAAGKVEPWCHAILDAWRDAIGEVAPIEPWDWWWAAGKAERAFASSIPCDRLLPIAIAHAQSLGADVDALGIGFDVVPRPGRPPVPVAYAEFGGRPRQASGGWSTSEPWVFASYTLGGLGELTELIHEIGHAIHIAAIRTRPAFADWPDSDAFTEALAEVLALDTAEPAWQERFLGAAVSERAAIRGRYADVVLDTAWALFEIRMLRDPDQRPNDVWTAITGEWLRIAPHPEWSWWAIRGQLASDPGYMSNYAVGAVLAADIRQRLHELVTDDGEWYAVASDHLFRFGLERPSDEVISDFLGRAPDPRALVAEIARMR